MTTMTQTTARATSSTLAIACAAFMGLGIMIFAGHLQAATLHDAAHDMRHASSFPCH